MSKNLTRKGLAFGALVALASSLIAGAPASAAGVDDGSVTIKPTTGTSYNALLATDFKLDVNYVSGIAVNGAKLSALIEDATAQAKVSFSQADVATATKTYTSGSVVVQSASTPDSSGAATADVLRLSLPTDVTSTTAVGVTVWYDSNADKVIDSNEKVAAKKTVTFYKASDITWNVVLNQPAVSATTLTATVSPATALNGEQIGDDSSSSANSGAVYADFSSSVSSAQTTAANGVTLTSVYNVDDKNWLVTSPTITAAAAGDTYGVQAKVAGDLQGSRVYTSVAAVAAAKATSGFTVGADVDETGAIRSTQRTFVYTIAVTKSTGAAVAAGIPVAATFTLGGSSWTGNAYINGVEKTGASTLKSTSQTATATAYTDAKGVATFTVKAPEDVAAGDTLTMSWASIQGAGTNTESGGSANGTADDVVTATWTATEYSIYEVTKHSANASISSVSGTATSIPLKVVDQWGQPFTAADYYVKAVATSRTVATTYTAISNGTATITVPDAALTTGDGAVALTVYKKNSDGSYTQADGSGTTKDATNTNGAQLSAGLVIKYVSASATYANVIDSGLTLSGSVSADEIAKVDTQIDNLEAPVATTGRVTISGTVKNAVTGAAASGALVTVSGEGLLFNVGSAYGLGSLSFYASETGTYTFYVHANKSTDGTVVTVTSNGVAATKSVTFSSSLDAKSLVVTAPAYAAAGTAVDVVATLADKWGNGVSASSLTLSSTGAGYLNATGSTTTLTSGVVRAKLIFGAAESGSAVIKAVVTTSSTYVLEADKTKTATVTIGAAPVVAPAAAKANVVGKTKAFSVSVSGNAAAKNVVVKVAGKTVATLAGSASAKTYTVKATKGSKKVTVYVGGKLIATKTVSVK
jgi:hypothetical protein